jgi:hypothetical protein
MRLGTGAMCPRVRRPLKMEKRLTQTSHAHHVRRSTDSSSTDDQHILQGEQPSLIPFILVANSHLHSRHRRSRNLRTSLDSNILPT